ncbi:MAG: tRNA (pseudouridine(54)-N(1))-methyltransferase TrmY [Candidatus Thermoplasmatota archaeon]|jgi:tRNA (pseudouridine54-N1)-methyltransferase|nr:tRNA (pseudouridine(54)-N(1))-methyltransferase TrmY [Candidatus Thermoplasmatota archaeon]MCL5963581.1 tRNA (pseudouridine(54)-N(1))-methyltransferase TrmY [Candidatus Thermoplasmatota archaeon]
MRSFLLVSHTVKVNGDFSLNSLAGDHGRIDILCHVIKNCFLVSNGIRTDTILYIYFATDKLTIKMDGSSLKFINPDERSTASIIRNIFKEFTSYQVTGKEYHPGITLYRWSIEDILKSAKVSVIYLKEGGGYDPLSEESLFVLGDSMDLSADEEKIINRYAINTVSISPISLHADQCITVIHNRLDMYKTH